MIAFATPLWLLALLWIPLRIALVVFDRRRGTGAFDYSSVTLVGRGAPLLGFLAWIPFVLELAAVALLSLALARPQRVTRVADERRGIDIVVVLDASGSMGAVDFEPDDRFTVAKDLVAKFIDSRANDRIGIVTFGSRAATRVPVTFDRDIARDVLADAAIGVHGDGTAIGHAIATGVNRLRRSKSRSRVLVLLTDGVNNAGSIDPVTAGDLARRAGVKIYAIGVGSRGPVPVRVKVQDPLTGAIAERYQIIRADLDEEMLTGVASATGGAYWRATSPAALENVLGTIDSLEKSPLSAPRSRTIDELYGRPMRAGILLLLLAAISGETLWMRLRA
ncbi:MAG: VWA domain-containing protein [Thermoanaerobaculia bacterium]